MRILVLSAYHAASHDYWLKGMMTALPDYQWEALSLPPRFFNWRIRGNPLSWLSSDQPQLNTSYDLIIATSTVDVATLRGLVPAWRKVPWVAYFHENQFAYPPSPQGDVQQRVEPQMVNLYTALAADVLWFNSQFNLDTLLTGCEGLCRKLPDQVPSAGWFEHLRSRAQILPVPLVHRESTAREKSSGQPLRVVWNHRWEYDKGVDRLLAMVNVLNQRQVSLELTVLGQRFRKIPPSMEALLALPEGSVTVTCPDFIADQSAYFTLLKQQDVVLSTSLHDFQGLSIMEAVQVGCVPLLPDRLCYPEFFGEVYRYAGIEDDLATESQTLADHLQQWMEQGLPEAPDISGLEWDMQAEPYRQAIGRALGNNFG